MHNGDQEELADEALTTKGLHIAVVEALASMVGFAGSVRMQADPMTGAGIDRDSVNRMADREALLHASACVRKAPGVP